MSDSTVILLHGLARSAPAMGPMRRPLVKAEFAARAPSYPSRRGSFAELGKWVVEAVDRDLGSVPVVAVSWITSHRRAQRLVARFLRGA